MMVSETSYEFNKKSLEDLENTDIEKTSIRDEYEIESAEAGNASSSILPFFTKILSLFGDSVEMNGIEPISDEQKTDTSLFAAGTMWLSANSVIGTAALGALGPLTFGLNFGQSVLVCIFWSLLGALPVAFFSVFGAATGLRQMVLCRYLMGNVTARVFALINVVACIGWTIVNTIASAQLLRMVNRPHNLPPWAGCLIIILATWIIPFFGYRIVHMWGNVAWIPNFIIFLIVIARLKMSGSFTNTPWEGGETTVGNVFSFGSTIYGFAIGWLSYIADYSVYMPRDTSKTKLFSSVFFGLMFPLLFTLILGAACGAATLNNSAWMELYDKYSFGGVVYGILVQDSLHGFGQFCCVVLSLSTVANNIPNMYSLALGTQSIYEPLINVPRPIWTTLGAWIGYGLSVAAYYKFESFMENFMDSISYYLCQLMIMCLSEFFIWRKGSWDFDVTIWNDWKKLPIGYASMFCFLTSIIWIAMCMSQSYYIGKISQHIGAYGGDISIEVLWAYELVFYNVLRYFEFKYVGR